MNNTVRYQANHKFLIHNVRVSKVYLFLSEFYVALVVVRLVAQVSLV